MFVFIAGALVFTFLGTGAFISALFILFVDPHHLIYNWVSSKVALGLKTNTFLSEIVTKINQIKIKITNSAPSSFLMKIRSNNLMVTAQINGKHVKCQLSYVKYLSDVN